MNCPHCSQPIPDEGNQRGVTSDTLPRIDLDNGWIGEREGFDGLWLYRQYGAEPRCIRDLSEYEEDFVRRAYARGRTDATLCTPGPEFRAGAQP